MSPCVFRHATYVKNAVFFFGLLATLTIASAAKAQTVEEKWLEFQSNTKSFMNQPPVKRDVRGQIVIPRARFSPRDVRTGEYIELKGAYRNGEIVNGAPLGSSICDENGTCLKDVLNGRAAARQRAEDFLDLREIEGGRVINNINEMDSRNLLSAKLAETPWSDSYWPIYEGILGARYASNKFRSNGRQWKSFYEYVTQDDNTLLSIYKSGDQEALNRLSPSEKYDLLLGDLTYNGKEFYQGYLTPSQWEEGRRYWNNNGSVEEWMGICHGWAAAAFMLPRPSRSVQATSFDGSKNLKFYPADIKGLASYVWAKAAPSVRFIGGRCNDKKVRRDEATGRILDEHCFDTNPGNWHTIVVNQIALAKRSFIIDATYDYEVWNQPVYSYSYSYFNPETGQTTQNLSEALIDIQAYSNDKFKRFRSPEARAIVGVNMRVDYVVETNARQSETDSPANDAVQNVEYMYDLELDEAGNIIGGEWYSNHHPDFLWLPLLDSRATTYGDNRLMGSVDGWDLSQPLPRFWADIGIATAVRYNQPLALIIEKLISEANPPSDSQ